MSKEAKFEKAAFGYRPEEVDAFVAECEKKLAAAKSEKAELIGKMKILADKITEYRSDEGNLKEAMLGAQRLKASIENEAKSKLKPRSPMQTLMRKRSSRKHRPNLAR